VGSERIKRSHPPPASMYHPPASMHIQEIEKRSALESLSDPWMQLFVQFRKNSEKITSKTYPVY